MTTIKWYPSFICSWKTPFDLYLRNVLLWKSLSMNWTPKQIIHVMYHPSFKNNFTETAYKSGIPFKGNPHSLSFEHLWIPYKLKNNSLRTHSEHIRRRKNTSRKLEVFERTSIVLTCLAVAENISATYCVEERHVITEYM